MASFQADDIQVRPTIVRERGNVKKDEGIYFRNRRVLRGRTEVVRIDVGSNIRAIGIYLQVGNIRRDIGRVYDVQADGVSIYLVHMADIVPSEVLVCLRINALVGLKRVW